MSKLTDLIIEIGAEPSDDMRCLKVPESVLHEYTERVTRGLVEALEFVAGEQNGIQFKSDGVPYAVKHVCMNAITVHRKMIGEQE